VATTDQLQFSKLVATVVLTIVIAHGSARASNSTHDDYGELNILYDQWEDEPTTDRATRGPVDEAYESYVDFKKDASEKTGLNWSIEIAPLAQRQIDGGAGSNVNNETNLIGQWALVEKDDPTRGNLLMWYQFSNTWSSKTTTELMQDLGVVSPINGGDTYPDQSRNLTQHFAWEQHFVDDRMRIQFGKLTTRVLLNLNRYAVSDREDFFTPMIVNNPVVDYTARLGLGLFGEYKAESWYLSGMVRDADADLSKKFIDFESVKNGNWEYVSELAFTPENLAGLGKGMYRITGSYTDALDTAGDVNARSVSLSFDQDIGQGYGAFFRVANAVDTFRTFDRRIASGVQVKEPFGITSQTVGVGLWKGRPTDRALNDESGLDLFWRSELAPFAEVSAGAMVVLDPALKPDRDSVSLAQARLRLLF